MAIIYWKLGHLTADGFQRPLDGFLVFRDGVVFDVDSVGWDRGIRPGDALGEMKWRHPGAVWVPWQSRFYEKSLRALQEWLKAHAAAYQQTDMRSGWWEWPRLTEADWRRMADEVIPRWAQRLHAGIASHPWMAHWAADEGHALGLPGWSSASSWKTYVLRPEKEQTLWPRLPLRYVEGISQKTCQEWHRRRWQCVQDVPGLLSQIQRSDGLGTLDVPSQETVLTRRFDEPITQGIGDLMRQLGEELSRVCREGNQGVCRLQVTWTRPGGVERREREWPQPAGDEKAVVARVLSLLAQPPAHPFEHVQLEAHMAPLMLPQMRWWETPRRPDPPQLAGVSRFAPSRRELLLQYWDLWRMAGERG